MGLCCSGDVVPRNNLGVVPGNNVDVVALGVDVREEEKVAAVKTEGIEADATVHKVGTIANTKKRTCRCCCHW